MIENPTQSILDKLGHGARATTHHAILLSIIARSEPVICAVLLLSVRLVVAVVGLVRVQCQVRPGNEDALHTVCKVSLLEKTVS